MDEIWFALYHIFPATYHLLILDPHAWSKCWWVDASIQVFQWKKWFYQLHLILPSKQGIQPYWLQASSTTGWRGHDKSRGIEEPGVQLERLTWSACHLWHCFEVPRHDVKVSCCDPPSQATTTTVPCKADHGSGCAVQDATNVRQPGPSHHTHWQCTTV